MDIPDGAHGDAPSDYEIELEDIELPSIDNIDRFFEEEAALPPPHIVPPGRRMIKSPHDSKSSPTIMESMPESSQEKIEEIKLNLFTFTHKIPNSAQAVLLVDKFMEKYKRYPGITIAIQEQLVKLSRHLRDNEILEADILQGMLEMDKGGEQFARIFKEFLFLARERN